MKIVFVTLSSLTIRAGQEKVLSTVANRLKADYSCDVRILSLPLAGVELRKEMLEDFRSFEVYRASDFRDINHYRMKMVIATLLSKQFLANYRSMETYLENLRETDIFVVLDPLLLTTTSEFVRKNNLKAKVVYWDHAGIQYYLRETQSLREKVKHAIPARLVREGILRADAFLAISSGIARIIKSIKPDANITMVYNPLPKYEGRLVDRPKNGGAVFLYVGRLEDRQKNITFMLKGLAKLKKKVGS